MSSNQKKPPWKKIYAALPFVCKYCRGLFPDFKFYRRHIRSHESRYKKFWYSREWRAARRFSLCMEEADFGYAQNQEDGTQGMTVSKIIKFVRRYSYGGQAEYEMEYGDSRVTSKTPSYARSISLEQAALIAHYQRMQLSKQKAPERHSDSEDHSDSNHGNSYHDMAMQDVSLLLSKELEQCKCSDCFRPNGLADEKPTVPSTNASRQQERDTSQKDLPKSPVANQVKPPTVSAASYGLPTSSIPVMLPCPHCPVSFDHADRLALHLKNHYLSSNKVLSPPGVTYQAAEVHSTSKISETKNDLTPSSKEHVKDYSSPMPLQQNQGNSSMNGHANISNNNNAKVQQKYHHTPKGYQSVTRKHTSEVIEDDLAAKPYSCPHCPKMFTYWSSLKTHEFTHTGKPPFACELCGEKFTQCSDLKLHERTHITTNPFKCEKCNRLFKHRPSLTAHERAHHSDDGKNVCPVCLKTFSVGSNLRDHLRIHTGERPYQCASCGRGFIQKSHLRKHVMIHTGERPFKCTFCNKGFTQRGDVRRHEKIHRKVK